MTVQTSLARPRVSVSWIILIALMGIGLVVALIRYLNGLRAISNLSDAYPWGFWISFDLLCGVALAAGAFTTAGAVYILGFERFRPVLRPAILTGFLGYLMVIIALLVDLGRPERIWHLIIYWNPHSVMFEVGWCVMLYTTVLALEFSPLVFERFGWKAPLRLIHAITIPLVIIGIVLSTLHQSSLGSLFLIVPGRLYPLWYSPLLPLFFFLTAAAVGPAVVIVESRISSRALNRGLELDLLGTLSAAIPLILGLYLILRMGDLVISGKWGLLFVDRMETVLFWIEILGGVVAPMILFSLTTTRLRPPRLFWSAMLVVGGVVLNRFDVSLLGLAHREDAWYYPHWMEFAITLAIFSSALVAYWLVARFLPLFAPEEHIPPITAK